MAKANRRDMGPGAQGKGSGSGAMTDAPEEMIEENMVLSNRDKARHPAGRGFDGKRAQTDQLQDHGSDQRRVDPVDAGER